uniref:Uncharacterized protein n=1 Tax=Aegilops tauschii subsp. strangulata TaxID=200361 RepID=A0A453DV56_AEGTS
PDKFPFQSSPRNPIKIPTQNPRRIGPSGDPS